MPTLDSTDYWRLRSLTAELERDQMQLALAEQRLLATRAKRQALWDALATQYSLDPTRSYQARDEDCSLLVAGDAQPT